MKKVTDMFDVRSKLKLSQKELAELLGWSTRQVSNVETGARPMSQQTALALECLLWRQQSNG